MNKYVWAGIVCLFGLGFSACSVTGQRPNAISTSIAVGYAADFPNGSVTAMDLSASFDDPDPAAIGSATPGVITQPAIARVSPVAIFLARDQAGNFLAFYTRDPYRGCRVKWVEAMQQYADPCHGSRYTAEGDWLSGPSPRNLDRFAVVVAAGGQVRVEVGKFQMGAQHP